MKLGQDDQQSQGNYVQTIYLVLYEHLQDVTSAKFMEKAKYYLKMELTMSQIGDKMHYTKAQREEVR